MKTVGFTAVIHLEPHAKGRPRASVVRGRPVMRTPVKTRAWEAQAAAQIREAMARAGDRYPYTGPLAVCVRFVRSRPKRRPAWATADNWKAGGRMYPPTKPDADNYVKALFDAANHAGLWVDDAQVVMFTASKEVAASGVGPMVVFAVSQVQP